jgi:DoxX-like family
MWLMNTPLNTISNRTYWLALVPFLLLFLGSAVWTLIDPEGARVQSRELGFPTLFVIPLGIAKLLGAVAIVTNKSLILKQLAFAGFLFDLILAGAAHFENGETYGFLAVFGMGLWACAFWADQRRYPVALVR